MAGMEALTDAELVQAITAGTDAARAEAELFRRFAPRIELYGRVIRHRAIARLVVCMNVERPA